MESNKLGEKIKVRRNELNLTLKELSNKCGIMPQLISDYENGRKEPGVKNLLILSKVLGITSDYMIHDEISVMGRTLENSYGNALSHYMKGLEISLNDELVVDKENNRVFIDIKDSTLKQAIMQMERLINDTPQTKDIIINFNINILSNVEIKKE